MRVIVTRPAGQAAEWVARFMGQGIEAASLPLIGIAPADDAAAIAAAWATLAQQRLVIFVSPNAAEQFFALRPPEMLWPSGTRAASPGPGTSDVLRGLGVPAGAIIEPAADAPQFDSESLWLALSAVDWQGAAVLIVRGEAGRDWLADTLRAHGAQVTYLTAYRRVPPQFDAAQLALLRDAAARPAQHLWLFSSSEAIDHLADALGAPLPVGAHALASHPRIAARARERGFTHVTEARPAADAVLAAARGVIDEARREAASACLQSPPTVSELPTQQPPEAATAPASAAAAAGHAPQANAPTSAAALPHLPMFASALSSARAWPIAAALLGLLLIVGGVIAWRADQRMSLLEQELVRRQQESADQSSEARMLAKQAEESARDNAAKVALLDARVAEVAVQRGQLEELIQSLSRSRDENLLVDVEAAVRVALQQAVITGSAEPLVYTLQQSDERLARYDQPRLEAVRRAIARDLDRVKSVSVTDMASLGIKLDEAVRLVDELPLLSTAEVRRDNPSAATVPTSAQPVPSGAASAASQSAWGGWSSFWPSEIGEAWSRNTERLWGEAKSLVRVTRIEHPEAMLLAPEQAFFLRENLKLRLLNARLALLSRQFDTAQSDLQLAQKSLDRYFDRNARRTIVAVDLVKQVGAQAHQVAVPRPDDTLAALAAASAGR